MNLRFKTVVSLLLLCFGLNTFGQESMRRWRKMNQVRNDKFDLVLPEVMRENNIDMWIITNREGNFDPLYSDMGEGYVSSTGYYIFTDNGGDRIERAVLGIGGYLLEKSNAFDYFGSSAELLEFVQTRNPKINWFKYV